MKRAWLALLPLGAYWSVWADYGLRWAADEDLRLFPLSALAGLWLLWRPAAVRDARAEHRAFALALAVASLFAFGYALLLPMARYALALLGTGAFVAWQRRSARPLGGIALMLLAVPALSQVERLLGPALRIAIAEAAAALLRAGGRAVVNEGTRLSWLGGFVDVDAPCAGLRMLWTGCFVTLLAVAHFSLSRRDALLLSAAAPCLILLANVLRCAALFYVESGILPAPSGTHAGIGLVAIALWESARWFTHRRSACAIN